MLLLHEAIASAEVEKHYQEVKSPGEKEQVPVPPIVLKFPPSTLSYQSPMERSQQVKNVTTEHKGEHAVQGTRLNNQHTCKVFMQNSLLLYSSISDMCPSSALFATLFPPVEVFALVAGSFLSATHAGEGEHQRGKGASWSGGAPTGAVAAGCGHLALPSAHQISRLL